MNFLSQGAEFAVEIVGLDEAIPCVIVHGEVDMATAPELDDKLSRLLHQAPGSLVLDVADVSFMDCAGLSVIASALQQLPDRSQLIIRRPPPFLSRLLDITGLAENCVMATEAPITRLPLASTSIGRPLGSNASIGRRSVAYV